MERKATFKVVGASDLAKELSRFTEKVELRATKTAVRRTAIAANRSFRSRVPYREGNLRKSMGYKVSKKHPIAWVGLRNRFYYKTLEFGRGESAPLRPFFEEAWQAIRRSMRKRFIVELRKALYYEAGKAHARTRARKL